MGYTVLQENSGPMTATSGTSATLGTATTTGTTVILVLGSNAATPTLASLTGWTLQSPASTSTRIYTRVTAGGETSWALTETAANACNWFVFEVDGLDTTALIDTKPSTIGGGSGTTGDTVTSGTNAMSTVYDGMGLVVHNGSNTANSTQPVWSAIGSGFTQELQRATTVGATAVGTSVSLRSVTDPATWDVAGTSSVTVLFANTHIIFACAGARRAPMFDAIAGFEWGTVAGLGTTAGQNPFDAITGSPAIVTTNPRTGSYCLELSSSAAAEFVSWAGNGHLGLYGALAATAVVRLAVLFPSSLPGGDLPLLSAETAQGLVVRYVSASQQIGVKVGAGTEQLSSATVAADVWYGLDLLLIASTTAASIAWQVDGVAQTTATGTTVNAAINSVAFGWVASQTGTVRYDDLAVSKQVGQYPIGDIRVYGLGPDPAGTVTATTTADFQTFTANGTTAAWNAATALAAVDDVPPTIGASADGVVQSVSSATDYVEVPMLTRNAAANGQSIRAVRWYFPGWAASATAATIGFRGFDGTTETTTFVAADPNFDNSTTTPGWVCRMHRTLGSNSGPRVITQAQLDALTARIGFGNAAVKVGVHAVLAEVAMRNDPLTQRVAEVTGLEGVTSTAFVDARLDADSAAVIGYDATPAPDFDATVGYTERGTPTTTALPAGAAVATEIVGADTVDDVTNLTIGPA